MRTMWLGLALAAGMVPTAFAGDPAVAAAGPEGRAKAAITVNLGPMIGALTPSSAAVWVRLTAAGTAYVAYRTLDAQDETRTAPATTSANVDYTLKFSMPDLQPDTDYQYQVAVVQPKGTEIRTGIYYFHTSPDSPQSLTFSVMADFMNGDLASPALVQATTPPRPDFLAVIGDMDHRNPAIDPTTKTYFDPSQSAKVLASMRKMRRDMRWAATPVGQEFVDGLMTSPDPRTPQIPLYYVWDDHDFCGNNSDATCPFVAQSLQVYLEDFLPAADNGTIAGDCGQTGVWQSITKGTLATVLMLDSRSNRDEAGGTTMLGACQKAWLFDRLLNATTTWKIVLSPVTLNPGTKLEDAWGHFSGEYQEIVSFIHDNNIANVIFLSGDIHSGGAIDDGTHSGVPEVSVPHSNMPATWVDTYCKLDRSGTPTLVSQPGTWTIGGFVDPNIGVEPHQCLGKIYKDSVAVSTLPSPPYPLPGAHNPGFASVQLTPTTATVRVLDQNGQQRSGFLADGTSADMVLMLQAQ